MLRSGIARLLSLAVVSVLGLAGCSTNFPVPTTHVVKGMSGAIYGGQQPISAATIQLYAVGTAGDGSASTALLTQTVVSDANGNFNVTGLYTCPSSSSLVYITGTGGSPSSGITNPQIALMAALGPCGALTASTFVNIDEITTVAAVYALAPFITSYSAIGSGASDAANLALDFTYAGYIANPATGATPGTGLPASYSVPIAQVDTIADLLAACINSPGGVSGDTSVCGQFFALSLPAQTLPPTDTMGAILNLARNPTLNTSALYNLIPPASPFQPTQPLVPPDLAIRFIAPSAFVVSPASLSFASAIIGFSQPTQTVTVTNGGSAAVSITSASVSGVNASDFAIASTTCATTVPANSTCNYQVSFAPGAAGLRSAYLVLANSSANPSLAVALAGSGTGGTAGPVTLTPATLNFDATNTPQTATLTNNGSTTLTINAIQISTGNYNGPQGGITCGATLAAMSSCTITLQPNFIYTPPAQATLTVVDDASTGPQAVTLLYTGGGPNYPNIIDFGHWAAGTTATQSFNIAGPGTSGGYNLTITGAAAASFSGPSSCSYSYRQSANCSVSLQFHPTTAGTTSTAYLNMASFAGNYTAQAILTATTDPAGVDFDVFQYVSGSQFSGSLAYGPPITALNLGSSVIGTPSNYGSGTTIQIKNTGTVSLSLNSPVISGANASDFTVATVSCAAGCYPSVIFTPSGYGTRTATLTYTDSTNTVTRTLNLTGTATTPAPALTSSNSLLFTGVPAGTVSAAQTITVTAYNNDPVQLSLAPINSGGPQPFVFTGPTFCPATPCQISVAYAPSTSDAGNGIENVYVIATDTAGQSSGNIQLAGQVAPYPYVSISPSSLTFASQAVNTVSAPQTVTFTNTGSTVLNLTFSVTPYASDYALTNNCPASLAVNASCTVSVSFTPKVTGTLAPSLVVNGSNVTRYVSLSGTAF